jgi:hypothetical protein
MHLLTITCEVNNSLEGLLGSYEKGYTTEQNPSFMVQEWTILEMAMLLLEQLMDCTFSQNARNPNSQVPSTSPAKMVGRLRIWVCNGL